jgi:uncharacterized membrane protein
MTPRHNPDVDVSSTVKFSGAGAALAAASALLFCITAPLGTASAADDAKVKCEGVNACKGQSACGTAKNSCAGQNACKGQGYLMLPKAQCDKLQAEQKK